MINQSTLKEGFKYTRSKVIFDNLKDRFKLAFIQDTYQHNRSDCLLLSVDTDTVVQI